MLNVELTSDSNVTSIQEKWKHTPTKTCTYMFIEKVFVIAKMCGKFQFSSTSDGIHELWYMQPMEYYSFIKRKEVLIHVRPGMNLGNDAEWKKEVTKNPRILWFGQVRPALVWAYGREAEGSTKETGFIGDSFHPSITWFTCLYSSGRK